MTQSNPANNRPERKFTAPGYDAKDTEEIELPKLREPLTDEQFIERVGHKVFTRLTEEDKAAINASPELYDGVMMLHGDVLNKDNELRRDLELALFGASDIPSAQPPISRLPEPQPLPPAPEQRHASRRRHERRRPSGKVLGAGLGLAAVGAAAIGIGFASTHHDGASVAPQPGHGADPFPSPNTQNTDQLREFFSQPDLNDRITDPSLINDFAPRSQAIHDGDHDGMMTNWENLFRGKDTGTGALAVYASAMNLPEAPHMPDIKVMTADRTGNTYRAFIADREAFVKRMNDAPAFHKQIYDKVTAKLKQAHIGDRGEFKTEVASDYVNRKNIDPNDPHYKEILLDLAVNENRDPEYRTVIIFNDDGSMTTLYVLTGCSQIGWVNSFPVEKPISLEAPVRPVSIQVTQTPEGPTYQVITPPPSQPPSKPPVAPPPTKTPPPSQPPSPPPEYHKGNAYPAPPAPFEPSGPLPQASSPAQVPTTHQAPSGAPDTVTIAPHDQTGGVIHRPEATQPPLPTQQGPTGSVTAPSIIRNGKPGSR